jgi:hypothetical protein
MEQKVEMLELLLDQEELNKLETQLQVVLAQPRHTLDHKLATRLEVLQDQDTVVLELELEEQPKARLQNHKCLTVSLN